MKHRTLKALPEYLQPKILSAVAYVNECSPNLDKAVERVNTLQKHLSEKEIANFLLVANYIPGLTYKLFIHKGGVNNKMVEIKEDI